MLLASTSDGPPPVVAAATRISRTLQADKRPSADDLALVLVFVLEAEEKRKAAAVQVDPPRLPAPPEPPVEPRSSFGRRTKRPEEETGSIASMLRRRLGVTGRVSSNTDGRRTRDDEEG